MKLRNGIVGLFVCCAFLARSGRCAELELSAVGDGIHKLVQAAKDRLVADRERVDAVATAIIKQGDAAELLMFEFCHSVYVTADAVRCAYYDEESIVLKVADLKGSPLEIRRADGRYQLVYLPEVGRFDIPIVDAARVTEREIKQAIKEAKARVLKGKTVREIVDDGAHQAIETIKNRSNDR